MRRRTLHTPSAFRQKPIDGLVREIVESSLPPARRRISTEATTMSAGELRGYLRARALVAVRDQTRRLSAQYHLDDSLAEQLAERALERTINLLLRERTEQPFILPMYEAPRRAAA
jgi:hypothetical protein